MYNEKVFDDLMDSCVKNNVKNITIYQILKINVL